MTWLLVVLAGVTLFVVGYLVGYINGQDKGAEDAYRAVQRWHER